MGGLFSFLRTPRPAQVESGRSDSEGTNQLEQQADQYMRKDGGYYEDLPSHRDSGRALDSDREPHSSRSDKASRGRTPRQGGTYSARRGTPRDSPPKDRTVTSFRDVRWQRGGLLGHGSFGKVYLGLNLDTGELLAAKEMPISQETDMESEEVEQIKNEIYLMTDLKHENIVRYIGSQHTPEYLYIFLEYVPGGSISSLLQRFGKFNERLTGIYARQMLAGLKYLHDHSIVHRDIKGGNILVDNNGVVKIADFGASKKLKVKTGDDLHSLRGTPYWMAPEVIRQSGYARPADIWSVGCTVIEMLTGQHPWGKFQDQVSALFHIGSAKSPPPLPTGISSAALDFLHACFKMNPDERPTAGTLMRHPFLANINGPTSPSASSFSQSSRIAANRQPQRTLRPPGGRGHRRTQSAEQKSLESASNAISPPSDSHRPVTHRPGIGPDGYGMTVDGGGDRHRSQSSTGFAPQDSRSERSARSTTTAMYPPAGSGQGPQEYDFNQEPVDQAYFSIDNPVEEPTWGQSVRQAPVYQDSRRRSRSRDDYDDRNPFSSIPPPYPSPLGAAGGPPQAGPISPSSSGLSGMSGGDPMTLARRRIESEPEAGGSGSGSLAGVSSGRRGSRDGRPLSDGPDADLDEGTLVLYLKDKIRTDWRAAITDDFLQTIDDLRDQNCEVVVPTYDDVPIMTLQAKQEQDAAETLRQDRLKRDEAKRIQWEEELKAELARQREENLSRNSHTRTSDDADVVLPGQPHPGPGYR